MPRCPVSRAYLRASHGKTWRQNRHGKNSDGHAYLRSAAFLRDVWVTTPFQLGLLRFLLGFADGAMLPAVQTLLVKYSSDQITGRIFGYNQSFMYLGNVVGPLMGATVSAMAGFRWVFIATAAIVLINIGQLTTALRRRRNAQKAKGQ